MKFIPLHSVDADNRPFRFFVNAEKIVAIYPASGDVAKRGYRTTVVLRAENEEKDLAVTEKIETVIKRINGEN